MRWGGKWEGGSGWGTHVHPWLIHGNVRQKPLQNNNNNKVLGAENSFEYFKNLNINMFSSLKLSRERESSLKT